MTWLSTRELYGIFLESEWWRGFSRIKRRMAGKCERCGESKRLQSHHRLYRDNWFDTKLEDLEVLCRGCHEKEHGIVPAGKPKAAEKSPAPVYSPAPSGDPIRDEMWRQWNNPQPGPCFIARVPQAAEPACPYATVGELHLARSQRSISRAQFKRWRLQFAPEVKRKKLHRVKVARRAPAKRRKKKVKSKGVTPWHYNPRHKSRWVSRGSSSN